MANKIQLPKDFAQGGIGISRFTNPNIYELFEQIINEHNALVDEFEAHTHKTDSGTRNTSTPQVDPPSTGNDPGVPVTPSEKKLEVE